MKTKKGNFRAAASMLKADPRVDRALWAAYRRHDRSRVTKYLLQLYLRLPSPVRHAP